MAIGVAGNRLIADLFNHHIGKVIGIAATGPVAGRSGLAPPASR
jgi:hypothetical protein